MSGYQHIYPALCYRILSERKQQTGQAITYLPSSTSSLPFPSLQGETPQHSPAGRCVCYPERVLPFLGAVSRSTPQDATQIRQCFFPVDALIKLQTISFATSQCAFLNTQDVHEPSRQKEHVSFCLVSTPSINGCSFERRRVGRAHGLPPVQSPANPGYTRRDSSVRLPRCATSEHRSEMWPAEVPCLQTPTMKQIENPVERHFWEMTKGAIFILISARWGVGDLLGVEQLSSGPVKGTNDTQTQ